MHTLSSHLLRIHTIGAGVIGDGHRWVAWLVPPMNQRGAALPRRIPMLEFEARPVLSTAIVDAWDVTCGGARSEPDEPETVDTTQLVFPYRGVFVRHVGAHDAVADASQVLFFNAGEEYRISHPVRGGDACLSLSLDATLLREVAPAAMLAPRPRGSALRFAMHRVGIDPRTQVMVALLRHGLRRGTIEPFEAESLALTLVTRALRPLAHVSPGGSVARQKLVDRIKLLLASDLGRRWTLADIAAEVRGSPVYLTQVFQQVEGVPLYRYHLRLRLARALDLLDTCEDLTALSLELGFSSHSHFSAAFRETYGRSPSEFRRQRGR
jgi:AraC family transcriptional regulator